MSLRFATQDANEAVASIAYRLNETIAIYPITPSSPMAEHCDDWSSSGKPNLWGTVPRVVEMQSEGGVAGAIHGMLQTGTLTTTFTASQGLLLMVPILYKLAGELLPICLQVTARTVATHALSIFGDHSDVMACRQTGVGMLVSNSVQEAHDLALIGTCLALESHLPFIHFFDGFRTSHEVAKFQPLRDDVLRAMVDEEAIAAFRQRALTPDRPSVRGTAQNPDVYFQAREACNPFYAAVPARSRTIMERFARLTGRSYRPFEYSGASDADRVVVIMGSGAETVEEASRWLNARGAKTGVLKVRLYRPWAFSDFIAALPDTIRRVVVLDRTKEPGAPGDPLYLDVLASFAEGRQSGLSPFAEDPLVLGGRYGLASKEFDPAMARAVFDHLSTIEPRNHFTVGINDDVSGSSLPVDDSFDLESADTVRAVFYGLGSDGTVGANKNSIKIIGEETSNYAQGYFVYDSKKSGAITISHLRFGPRPIAAHYVIKRANFVACHHFQFLQTHDVLGGAAPGAVFLLNTALRRDQIWDRLPTEVQEQILAKRLRCYVIDASRVAREAGLGSRINTIMQTCFFAISGVLPREEAIAKIKESIRKTYRRKGAQVVEQNFTAVDMTLAGLHEMAVPDVVTASQGMPPPVPPAAPDFVKNVTGMIIAGKGDLLPVSAFPVDGTWPVGTSRWEKRNIASQIPAWDPALCIQCNKCVLVCPHAAVRAKYYDSSLLPGAPAAFKSADFHSPEIKGCQYTLQIAPEDCTGCTLCVQVCPARDKSNPRHKALEMTPQAPVRTAERHNFDFFLGLPPFDRTRLKPDVKLSQFCEPLFEFSGACAGCGETPYLKLLTQLFGDRLLLANATGCSSIYGGNLPTTPYCTDHHGRGPAWSNSLFEDNAEYGFGMRFALDQLTTMAQGLLKNLAPQLGDPFVQELLEAEQRSEAGIAAQRARVTALRGMLAPWNEPAAHRLAGLADYLVRKSVWIVGGDGWAYDIGFGGLDHVLALNHDVNFLVLDTGVYSNTGGQSSKATPLGAVAKFAASGKPQAKKDLGLMAISYGSAYVAQIAFGARDSQTVKVLEEAERYPGASLVIAYSHCIAHGYPMAQGLDQQKLAVDTGAWMLYRFDPRRVARGESPLQLDGGPPKENLGRYLENELRFRMLEHSAPERYRELKAAAIRDAERRVQLYRRLAESGAWNPAPAPAAT